LFKMEMGPWVAYFDEDGYCDFLGEGAMAGYGGTGEALGAGEKKGGSVKRRGSVTASGRKKNRMVGENSKNNREKMIFVQCSGGEKGWSRTIP